MIDDVERVLACLKNEKLGSHSVVAVVKFETTATNGDKEDSEKGV